MRPILGRHGGGLASAVRAPERSASDHAARCELRCGCGSLLARRVSGGVELKCRRCKRTLILPLLDG